MDYNLARNAYWLNRKQTASDEAWLWGQKRWKEACVILNFQKIQ